MSYQLSWRLCLGLSLAILVVLIGGVAAMRGIGRSVLGASIPPAEKVLGVTASTSISTIIVPHHNLVQGQRDQLFKKLQPSMGDVRTVILIGPNHPNIGSLNIQTTLHTWRLSDGSIAPDVSVVSALESAGVASEEEVNVRSELSITTLLTDVKTYLPKAKIVPITLKENTPLVDIERLNNVLRTACGKCLLIASVDFSHYQPALLAQLHDRLTVRYLETLDTNNLLSKAEVDSPASLALATLWARGQRTEQFHEELETNSGIIYRDLDGETTTHVFGWYQVGAPTLAENSVSFIVGGDMMFGRAIAYKFPGQKLFNSISQLGNRVFWGTDAALVNLEGPISPTEIAPDPRPNNLIFNFPPEVVQVLKFLHINTASLANNHSLNAGQTGLGNTRQVLRKAGISSVGDPSKTDTQYVTTITGHNMQLHIIGINTLSDTTDITPLIKQLKTDGSHKVLVFPHWGNEYSIKHSPLQSQLAHRWIDAGADLVIGSHPHVIQDAEVYNGHPIFYSVGNLLFDQDFSLETQRGLLLAGDFTAAGLRIFALPTQSLKYQPALLKGAVKKNILDKLQASFQPYLQSTPAGTIIFFPVSK